MVSYADILGCMDEIMPNTWPQETKKRWIFRVLQRIRPYVSRPVSTVFPASEYITMPDGVNSCDILNVFWNSSGFNNTNAKNSKEYFHLKNAAIYSWQEAAGPAASAKSIHLSPAPTSGEVMLIHFAPLPTPTLQHYYTDLGIYEECQQVVVLGALEIAAKSGNTPDVMLANNFHADYLGELARIKLIQRNRLNPAQSGSYRDWE